MHFHRSRLAVFAVLFVLRPAHSAADSTPTLVKLPTGITRVDDIGLYEVGWRYRDGRTGSMPIGWTGHFEDSTGISCTPFGDQDDKAAFLIHPPWRGGTGVTDQTFLLSLPNAKGVVLRFAVAMKTGEVGPTKSDGATFRVFVNNNKLYDYNQTSSNWSPASLNLTAYAGKTISLKFETDPGPKDNPSYDYAFWGGRVLETTGTHNGTERAPGLFPQPARALDTDYIKSAIGSVCPPAVKHPSSRIALTTGTLDKSSKMLFKAGVTVESLSGRHLTSPMYGIGSGAYLDLVGGDGKNVRSDSPQVSATSQEKRLPSGLHRTIHFEASGRDIAVEVDLTHGTGDFVKIEIQSKDPYVAAVHFGTVGPAAFRRQVAVPYYGSVQFLPDMGLFTNVIMDHKASASSSISGDESIYTPLTDGSRNRLHETAYYAISPDLACVLPVPGNPASPFRTSLSKRIVLDSWGGPYVDNAAFLRELATYRITNLLTIAHVWQNGGYDNKLPDVLPAYAPLGGDVGMVEWAKTATSLGELFSLHENYVDFYPNAPSWNEDDVALDSQGKRVPAWLNEGTGIQSFAVAPDAILKYARRITPRVHDAFKTNASYLDVHSAVPPWFHVDYRTGHEGAGKFSTVWSAHRDLWSLFRDTHRGPVLGEGNNHWYWSGLLDGVEAQFGTGVPGNAGETAPLFVDFDLMNIHPLQFNHGMGYLERWLPSNFETEWHSRIPSTKVLDQYRMQEVAFGHAGFIASPFQGSLAYIWQEHHLMSALTERYATASIQRIEYEVNGKLVPAAMAIASGSRFDRVHTVYSNGLNIWCNGRSEVWRPFTGGPDLPQYGWYALGAGLRAGTVLRRGITGKRYVCDVSQTENRLFVNSRAVTAGPPKSLAITPRAETFTQLGSRRFQIRFSWKVADTIPEGYVVFLHATGEGGRSNEKILFQPGSGMATPPSSWKVGTTVTGDIVEVTLPPNIDDGVIDLRAGLYSPAKGDRLRLSGVEDESGRIILGSLKVSEHGDKLEWLPAEIKPEIRERSLAWAEHSNPASEPVDFGSLVTDTSLLVERAADGGRLITPFPRNRPSVVRFTLQAFGSTGPVRVIALNEKGLALGQVTVSHESGQWFRFSLGEKPGATQYRVLQSGPAGTVR